MQTCAVESSLDVAAWFIDRALNDGEYLQPQKMHRLLYLSQAYFAVANHGRVFMPTLFVAYETGPVAPDVYRSFEPGRPYFETKPMTGQAADFLDSIWRRFGQHSADFLTRQIRSHKPFVDALANGVGTPLSLEAMREFYGSKKHEQVAPGAAPPIGQVLRPKVMRSHTGRPVSVHKWMPPAKPANPVKK